MLNIKNRLKKKKEFSYIYKKGEVYHSKFLTLYCLSTKLDNIRVGFSVSNKIGNSVVRHKVKRRMSEIVKYKISTLPHNNYIFVVKIGIDQLPFDRLKNEIEFVLSKIK